MSSLSPIIDFEVLKTYNLKVMLVADLSEWEHLSTENAYIDIKPPAVTNATRLRFEKGKVNVFNSSLLNLTPTTSESSLINLPDGLYYMCLYVCEGCKFREEKYYLRTLKTQLDLDEALIKLDLGNCTTDQCARKKIMKANQLLMSARANANHGNFLEAVDDFNTAKELLDEILECDDCN